MDGHDQSGFFQGRYKILDDLEFAAGVRYTRDTRALEHLGNTYVHTGATFLSPAGEYTGGSLTDSNWSPEATLTYALRRDMIVYAAYKTGYKSGTFGMPVVIPVGQTAKGTLLQPETSKGGEIGFKGEFLDHLLRLQTAVYTYNFDNLQTVSFDSATVSYVYGNAAVARTRGAEVQLDWRAMRELTINAAIAYNQARYLKYKNAQCYAGEAAPLCVDGHQDLGGAPLPYASDWMGNLGFTYDHPLGRNHFVVYASGDYQTRYNASEINIPHAEIGGYPLIDAGAHFGRADGLWDVALLGRNLTNSVSFHGRERLHRRAVRSVGHNGCHAPARDVDRAQFAFLTPRGPSTALGCSDHAGVA